MANPQITWTTPAAGLLPNDLYTITAKFGSEGTFASGGDNASLSGEYSSDIYALARTAFAVQSAIGPGDTDNKDLWRPYIPAHSIYNTEPQQGQISLKGGVYELLPYSCGQIGGSRTYTDYAGIGHSPTEPYATYPSDPSDVAGPLLCGAYTNVESQHSYTLATYNPDTPVAATYYPRRATVTWSETNTGGAGSGTGSGTDSTTYLAVFDPFSWYDGWYSVGSTTLYTGTPKEISRTQEGTNADGTSYSTTYTEVIGVEWVSTLTKSIINEYWEHLGTHKVGTSVTDLHTGAIVYEIMDDTEATLGGNPFQHIVSGQFSWSTGQARTVTVTCDEDHGLTDTSNRVYISNASQRVANAVNGLWNVATITSSTAFTIKIFGATCDAVVTSESNIIQEEDKGEDDHNILQENGLTDTANTSFDSRYYILTEANPQESTLRIVCYDGLDKEGGVLKTSGGSVFANVIAGGVYSNNKVILKGTVTPSSSENYTFHGNSTGATVFTDVRFTGETKAISLFYKSGLNLDRDTGRIYSTGAPSENPPLNSTDGTPNGFDGIFTTARQDVDMISNILLDGDTFNILLEEYVDAGQQTYYIIQEDLDDNGYIVGEQVSLEAAILMEDGGQLLLEIQPKLIRGASEPGMKSLDSFMPRFNHAQNKASEAANTNQVIKANTANYHNIHQQMAAEVVDIDENITTFRAPHEHLHDEIRFTMRAVKNDRHRLSGHAFDSKDYVDQDFYISLYANLMSARNDHFVLYSDPDNDLLVGNTQSAFSDADDNKVTNREFLALNYANGQFKNLT